MEDFELAYCNTMAQVTDSQLELPRRLLDAAVDASTIERSTFVKSDQLEQNNQDSLMTELLVSSYNLIWNELSNPSMFSDPVRVLSEYLTNKYGTSIDEQLTESNQKVNSTFQKMCEFVGVEISNSNVE